MNAEIPRSVVTGRRTAIALLVVATLITVFAAVWLIAAWVTQPIVV
jgi:hypothetical protein